MRSEKTRFPCPLPLTLPHTFFILFILVLTGLADVQAQTLRVEVDFVLGLLQDARDVLGVLELPEVDVRVALLDGVTDQLGRARLTLRPYDHGLLLLSRLVDDEGGALGFLLRDLLGFYGGGEFGGEGELLFVGIEMVSSWSVECTAHKRQREYGSRGSYR